MKLLNILSVYSLIFVLANNAYAQEIQILKEYPTVDETIEVKITNSENLPEGAEILVVYRPGSETEKNTYLGPVSLDGKFIWTPENPGIATIKAGVRIPPVNQDDKETFEAAVSKNVAICFAGLPGIGIGVMILAGILLFGGAAISLVIALRDKVTD